MIEIKPCNSFGMSSFNKGHKFCFYKKTGPHCQYRCGAGLAYPVTEEEARGINTQAKKNVQVVLREEMSTDPHFGGNSNKLPLKMEIVKKNELQSPTCVHCSTTGSPRKGKDDRGDYYWCENCDAVVR